MLHLQSESTARWLDQVDQHLNELLIDHAHCERKAASTAMNLMNAYTENRELCREMTRIVGEELEHFEMVLCLLDKRNIKFRRLAVGSLRPPAQFADSQQRTRSGGRSAIGRLIDRGQKLRAIQSAQQPCSRSRRRPGRFLREPI